jgi:hypothetical protein
MFVQVFHGKVRDPQLYQRHTEEWRREIRPKTSAFLGFTAGLTDDSQMVTVARFDSEAGARRDSDLAEQGAWFEEFSKNCEGITFHDCSEVDTMLDGGSNDAGFVQVMQGRAKNRDEMRSRRAGFEAELRRVRPDLIGATIAWHGDDDAAFTEVAYFTSEEEARRGEQQMAESSLASDFTNLIDGELTYLDLRDPILE